MKVFKIHLKGESKALRIEGDRANEVRATGSLVIRRGGQIVAQYRLTEIRGWNEEAAEKARKAGIFVVMDQ